MDSANNTDPTSSTTHDLDMVRVHAHIVRKDNSNFCSHAGGRAGRRCTLFSLSPTTCVATNAAEEEHRLYLHESKPLLMV